MRRNLPSNLNCSITTLTEYGSSSPVKRNTFSRSISAARNFSLRSVMSSCVVDQFARRQMAAQGFAQLVDLAAQLGADRHDGGKFKIAATRSANANNWPLSATSSILLISHNTGRLSGSSLSTSWSRSS